MNFHRTCMKAKENEIKDNILDRTLLPYCQGSNSVMQSDWLKSFEYDEVIEHYYSIIPAHDDTTHSFKFESPSKHRSVLRTRRATTSNSNKWLRLQWLHARPTVILALKSYFYFVNNERHVPCTDHRVIHYIINNCFLQGVPKILIRKY